MNWSFFLYATYVTENKHDISFFFTENLELRGRYASHQNTENTEEEKMCLKTWGVKRRGRGDGKLWNEEYFTETYLDWSILIISPEQFAIVYQIQIWEISLSSTDEVTEFDYRLANIILSICPWQKSEGDTPLPPSPYDRTNWIKFIL